MNYWNEHCNWAPVQYKIELYESILEKIEIPGRRRGYIEYKKLIYIGLVHFTNKVPM